MSSSGEGANRPTLFLKAWTKKIISPSKNENIRTQIGVTQSCPPSFWVSTKQQLSQSEEASMSNSSCILHPPYVSHLSQMQHQVNTLNQHGRLSALKPGKWDTELSFSKVFLT